MLKPYNDIENFQIEAIPIRNVIAKWAQCATPNSV